MKAAFIINPHSMVDVITNSSSELFVSVNNNKQDVIDLIESIYPNYLNEYDPVKSTQELSRDELESYLGYRYEYWSNELQTYIHERIPGLTDDEMKALSDEQYYYDIVTDDDERTNRIKSALDPQNKMFFLFSIDENPDWDYQKKLMDVMQRFHLG